MKKPNKKNQIKKGVVAILLLGAIPFFQSSTLQQPEWKAPASSKDKKNPVASTEASLATAKKIYEKECLSCHGKKGRGDGDKAADLDKPVADLSMAKVQSQTDGELFWKISNGNKPMPENKKTLTEEQIWQVVNYVRTLKKK